MATPWIVKLKFQLENNVPKCGSNIFENFFDHGLAQLFAFDTAQCRIDIFDLDYRHVPEVIPRPKSTVELQHCPAFDH